MEDKKVDVKIKVASSFINYIGRGINSNFKESDLEKGFTEILSSTLGGNIYYRRPPKDKMVKGVIKTRDIPNLKEELKGIIPNLIYFV